MRDLTYFVATAERFTVGTPRLFTSGVVVMTCTWSAEQQGEAVQ
jgi:hypothetical protein